MDRWRKAYTYFGFEYLDLRWERVLTYITPAAFWINLAAWLLTRDGLIPGIDRPLEWLTLALLSAPGNARGILFIALGPNRGGEWTTLYHNPDARPTPRRRWWKIWARVRRDGAGRRREYRQGRSRETRPWSATWTRPPGPGQVTQPAPWTDQQAVPYHHPAPVPARPLPHKGGSTVSTWVKVLIGLTILAVCGGYWLTGGTIVSPSDMTTDPPRLRNQDEKKHMLNLINEARVRNGVPPVVMGSNDVAQIQAESLLRDCVFSHWGTDGLKPYQRYSLAGGYQTNGENALTFNECGLADTLLGWNAEPMEMVTDAVEGWLESPGHRETMLNPEFRVANIGLAWDRNTFKAIQHFEGDYVELNRLPVIEAGVLEVGGSLGRGHTFAGTVPLIAFIVYDPRPRKLTGGQLARTYCYGHGEYIAALIPPSRLLEDEFEFTFSQEEPQCIDPYDVRQSAAEPESQEENIRVFEESREESLRLRETETTLSFRKADEMTVNGREFSIVADVSELLDEHGAGVYTVVLLASLEKGSEEPDTVISEYSIFHGVRAPGGYGEET